MVSAFWYVSESGDVPQMLITMTRSGGEPPGGSTMNAPAICSRSTSSSGIMIAGHRPVDVGPGIAGGEGDCRRLSRPEHQAVALLRRGGAPIHAP